MVSRLRDLQFFSTSVYHDIFAEIIYPTYFDNTYRYD